MDPQITYPMITQMSPRWKARSLPVRILAENEMAASTSRKIAVMTTMSTAKDRKRDAKPA